MDAPSRGHDLKLTKQDNFYLVMTDAPSRGHDLKLPAGLCTYWPAKMPPHGGTT